jgi:Holliday junction DNA helicase RuvA
MIGQLSGLLLEKNAPDLMIDVQGAGYEVIASMNTFYSLPEIGEMVKLYTHLVIREDQHLLFGFATREEKKLFRLLIKVNGIGPRTAISILSSASPAEFVSHIQENNIARLTRLPGIGKKTAERLLIEMRDSLKEWLVTSAQSTLSASQQAEQDALSALLALGYKPNEAKQALDKMDKEKMSSQDMIKQALKRLT